ncbi:MAG: ATP-binding protein [Anaerovibrio sp.]|nr:ATP-binding protein [Anaerovibrio sp.]
MKENRVLEFKECITNTFLKTVSAFANFGTGKIYFGVNDTGRDVGIENPQKACLDIENKINDNIQPKPDFSFSINERTNVICLTVLEGSYKPYFYKGKAYRRSDTASIEVDRVELSRLVLEGQNKYYEELSASQQDLHFSILEGKIQTELGIEKLNQEILKTLNLYNDKNGYNHAAELLADANTMPGIDIARFGASENVIMDRIRLKHNSVLWQLDQAMAVYKRYYVAEVIQGAVRQEKQLIPENAFREAIANALVHRTWDVAADIKISMYEDRIEINSPGGLPFGISEAEYLRGQLSMLRNPVLGNVFFRLRYIEMFGTGIRRIKNEYKDMAAQPEFKIYDNSITVVLPLAASRPQLSDDESRVYELFKGGIILSSSDIAKQLGFGKSKALVLVKNMLAKKVIKVYGQGRGTKYGL